jgi:ferric-dicitrate binding protein FerR (iron transport regulator)
MEEQIIKLLARKMAGEATLSELKELDLLLCNVPEAIYYKETLKQLWDLPVESDDNLDKIYLEHKQKYQHELKFLDKEVRVSRQFSFKNYRSLLNVACILLLFTLSVLIFFYPSNKSELKLKSTEIIAGRGIRKKIILPDGTLVWLNADSKLTYDMQMEKRNFRLVELSGEAFFDVAHSEKHPFIIKTPEYNIKVLGTAFNVKAYPCDRNSETTLIRGMIELTMNDESHQKIILKPSEKFALIERKIGRVRNVVQNRSKGVALLVENVEPVTIADKKYIREISWIENKLVFNNETFEELVPRLERWFNVNIEIQDEKVKLYHFTGVFTKESITEALCAMKLIRPFNFKLKEYDLTITKQ